jgi:hypothetical protein
MWSLQVVVILTLANSITAHLHCNKSEVLVKNRAKWRHTIANHGSISFAVKFAKINDDLAEEYSELRLMRLLDGDFITPPAVNFDDENNGLDIRFIKPRTNIVIGLNSIRKIQMSGVEIDDGPCMNQIGVYQMFQQSSITGCMVVMFACHVSDYDDAEKLFETSQKVLVFTKGPNELNDTEVEACLSQDLTFETPMFTEFESRGLCICQHIGRYLNDCDGNDDFEWNGKMVIFEYAAVVVVVLIALILVQYGKIIND